MCVTVKTPIVGGGTLVFEKSDYNDPRVTISTDNVAFDNDHIDVEISELLKAIAVLGGGLFSLFNSPIEKKEEE